MQETCSCSLPPTLLVSGKASATPRTPAAAFTSLLLLDPHNPRAVLEAAGTSLDHVVRVGVFLTSMNDFAAMNRVYDTYFAEPKPSRTCVAVAQLPMGTDVEVECIAHL